MPPIETSSPKDTSVRDVMAAISMVAPHIVAEARTLPLPVLRPGGRRCVIVLHFVQPALARKDLLYAPHQLTVVDLEDLSVVEHANCLPSDFGVSDLPSRRFTTFGLAHVPDDLFWRSRDEVARLAPLVWGDFFANRMHEQSDDEEGRARAAAFLASFERCTYTPLLPYLRGAAPDFFAWLETALRTDTSRPPSRRAPQVTPV